MYIKVNYAITRIHENCVRSHFSTQMKALTFGSYVSCVLLFQCYLFPLGSFVNFFMIFTFVLACR